MIKIGLAASRRQVEEPQGADAGCDEDARLMAAVCRRDLQAFEQLYRRHHPALRRFLLNIAHRPTIVEEVMNDTMMAVWVNPGAYRGESRLSTWIFAIAYRQAMRALKRQDAPVADRPEAADAPAAPPDRGIDRQRVQRLLIEAMAQLSPDHRAVIDLTYFHELGYREIAEIMDCPVDTVKTRMFHARRHLKRLLAGEPADWLQD